MSQIYKARRRAQDAPAAQKPQTSAPGPSLSELAAGAMPTTEQMGRRVDLPDAIREKMEASFGADFSGVKVYESQTVADAGAQAMTMGSNVAFAPGQLDLASTSGQALLGHELSHVVSQARGESAGQGFLADAGLEAQADRQGALAAQGESAYSGPVAPLSASAVPASAAGPMQTKKPWEDDISEPVLDEGATYALNHDKQHDSNEKSPAWIRRKYKKATKANLPEQDKPYSGRTAEPRAFLHPNDPNEAQLDEAWHWQMMNNIDYSQDEGLINEERDRASGLYQTGYEDMRRHTARDEHRAANGLTYANFKLGVANARARRRTEMREREERERAQQGQ